MLSEPALTSNGLVIQLTLDDVFWREGGKEGKEERGREGYNFIFEASESGRITGISDTVGQFLHSCDPES